MGLQDAQRTFLSDGYIWSSGLIVVVSSCMYMSKLIKIVILSIF